MELTAGSTRLVVDPGAGGRIASLAVGPDALQLVGRSPHHPDAWGCFPMAPWAGRVRHGRLRWAGQEHQLPVPSPPHAAHGLVRSVPWHVVRATASSAVLDRDIGSAWPWPARAVLRYDLEEDRLTTVLEVHATEAAMPAWSGLHPWFPRVLDGAEVSIAFQAAAVLLRDAEGVTTATRAPVPDGAPIETPVDDAFADVAWPVVLTWPGVARLSIRADAPWAVLFTEREHAVCVEPQTAPPDATALGLAPTVEPGAPLVLTTTWDWEHSRGRRT